MNTLSPQMAAVFLLTIAAGGWYAASRAAVDALGGGPGSPGKRALAYAMCSGVIAILAIFMNHPEMAVGIIFASSVASLTLVMGIATVTANHTRPTLPRRVWSFVLPVALIALLIGFSGGIGWVQTGMLAFEGAALLILWNDVPLAQMAEGEPHASSNVAAAIQHGEPHAKVELRIALMLGAILASLVAAYAAIAGAEQIASKLNVSSLGLIAALMLSPALLLSMIGSSSAAASEGRFDDAVASLVGFVLLNLCAVLPLTTALWLTLPIWNTSVNGVVVATPSVAVPVQTGPATAPTSHPASHPASTAVAADEDATTEQPIRTYLLYPLAVWRVDTVLMIAVGLLLLPVALGRWSLSRAEGAGLIAAYVIYMILTTYMAR